MCVCVCTCVCVYIYIYIYIYIYTYTYTHTHTQTLLFYSFYSDQTLFGFWESPVLLREILLSQHAPLSLSLSLSLSLEWRRGAALSVVQINILEGRVFYVVLLRFSHYFIFIPLSDNRNSNIDQWKENLAASKYSMWAQRGKQMQ